MLNLRHLGINTLGSVIPIAVILITIPIYLQLIGAEKYGVLSLVWIVFGYFGILDLGVGKATTSAVSRVRRDAQRCAETIWSALAVSALIGFAVGVVGGAIVLMVSHFWPSTLMEQVVPALPFLVLGIPVVTMTSVLNGALDGDERFGTANIVQVFGTTAYQVVPLVVAYAYSKEIVSIVLSLVLARVAVLLVFFYVCGAAFHLGSHRRISKAAAKDLIGFGANVAAINFVDPIFSRVDQLLVARFAGAESVAAYNIAVNSIGRLSILPVALSRSIFPVLATGTLEDAREQLLSTRLKVFYPWLALCVVAMFACDLVFELWLRNPIATSVSAIGKIFIVGLWVNCLSILPYTALQATGRSDRILKVHLLEMPFYLMALAALTHLWGASGAAIAYGLRNLGDHLLLWRLCGVGLRRQLMLIVAFTALAALAFTV